MSVYGSNTARGSYEYRKTHNADIPPSPAAEQTVIRSERGYGPHQRRGFPTDILPNGIDSDTLLIAALLFLLLKEGGDIRLVIALGYILL
ncbi:MAG: hypothetical protein MJ079_04510 [Ruminococcus sp.]|nr:hypothetical protein [Ruminococcus sp.]